jgi:hypothetical protein
VAGKKSRKRSSTVKSTALGLGPHRPLIVLKRKFLHALVVLFFCASAGAANAKQVAPQQQTLLVSDVADGGYFGCPRDGETFDAFVARWPDWFVAIQNRVPEQPMSYRLYEPVGLRVLIAEGAVTDGESERLRQALVSVGPIDEIWLSSPGGNSSEGLAMARVIRSRGLVTRIPRGYACISACSTAFLGGVLRYVDNGALYGIHMFTSAPAYGRFLEQHGRDPSIAEALFGLAEQNAARTASERSRFLIEMGVSLRWMDEAFRTRSSCVNYLSRATLRSLNVLNAR